MKRVVTQRTADGRSVFWAAGEAEGHQFEHIPGMNLTLLWRTPAVPDLNMPLSEPVRGTSLIPEPGGTLFEMLVIPPDHVMMSPSFDPVAAAEENLRWAPGVAETFEVEDPGMHTTNSVDYGIVMSGEIWLELDEGRTEHLRAGDVIIQHGTRHAWRNRGDVPARMIFILIGARPFTAAA